MTRRRSLAAVVSILLAGSLLAACGDDDEPGIPNPASAYCEEQGGTVEIERDATGAEQGICVLPDGTRVDEWEYYRQRTDE